MSSILSSQGVVLATTMVVSGTFLLLSLFRDKNFPPTHEQVSGDQDSHSSIPIQRSCFSSGGKRGERKKKKVKFADDVKKEEEEDSNGRKSRGGELRKKRKEVADDASSCGIQSQRMPPNRVALYGGILRDRLHRMACTKFGSRSNFKKEKREISRVSQVFFSGTKLGSSG